jgi:hypothetical protein
VLDEIVAFVVRLAESARRGSLEQTLRQPGNGAIPAQFGHFGEGEKERSAEKSAGQQTLVPILSNDYCEKKKVVKTCAVSAHYCAQIRTSCVKTVLQPDFLTGNGTRGVDLLTHC